MEQKHAVNDGTPAKTVSKPVVEEDREEILKSMTNE